MVGRWLRRKSDAAARPLASAFLEYKIRPLILHIFFQRNCYANPHDESERLFWIFPNTSLNFVSGNLPPLKAITDAKRQKAAAYGEALIVLMQRCPSDAKRERAPCVIDSKSGLACVGGQPYSEREPLGECVGYGHMEFPHEVQVAVDAIAGVSVRALRNFMAGHHRPRADNQSADADETGQATTARKQAARQEASLKGEYRIRRGVSKKLLAIFADYLQTNMHSRNGPALRSCLTFHLPQSEGLGCRRNVSA